MPNLSDLAKKGSVNSLSAYIVGYDASDTSQASTGTTITWPASAFQTLAWSLSSNYGVNNISTVYTTVNSNSSNWNYQGTDIKSLTGNWQNTYSTVSSNSATNWNYQGTDIKSLTSNWQNTYTTVNTNSATNWNYQGTDIKSLTANWQNTYSTVSSNSASWSGNYLPNIQLYHSTLTYAGSVALDFNGDGFQTVTLTGVIEFTTANLAAGRSKTIRIIGDSSSRALTFPLGWKFIGAAAPATLAANKIGILTLTSFGTTDANVVAAYAAEP